MSNGKYTHLISAPKELLDVAYCIKVAKGEIPPSTYAITTNLPDFDTPAEDVKDSSHAFKIGYGQGFEAELCSRAWQPTPPHGLPIAWLPSFCEGVLSGSEGVRLARETSAMGGGEGDHICDLGI